MSDPQNGKGSARRPEDRKKIEDNWPFPDTKKPTPEKDVG